MRNPDGLSAIVTGASSGIGEATGRLLAKRGWNVALVARRAERLDALAREINGGGASESGAKPGAALVAVCDVRDRASVESMVVRVVGEFGRIDALINNAGVMLLSGAAKANVDEWREMVEVNILGALHCAGAVLPHMLGREPRSGGVRGDIVNVGSAAGRRPVPQGAVYAGTKAFMHMWSEGLRSELAPKGVRVAIVAPGIVTTELRGRTTDSDVRARWRDAKPIEALTSEDVAEAIVWALERPGRVGVNEILMRPREQES